MARTRETAAAIVHQYHQQYRPHHRRAGRRRSPRSSLLPRSLHHSNLQHKHKLVMNYKITATIQWLLVFGAGVASLQLGKAYSREQAVEMSVHYKGATTREDISNAITAHNNEPANRN